MYGAILLFGVTLTLPGFAGLILTIGVAADANIVIFERIKEEARPGSPCGRRSRPATRRASTRSSTRTSSRASPRSSCSRVATAEREGLRADAADRHGHLARRPRSRRPARCSACSPASRGSTTRASWARPRRRSRSGSGWTSSAAAGSGSSSRCVAIGISIVALAVQGLNLGIDFKGGVQVTFTTPKPTSLADVRDQTAAIGQGDAIVQGRGTSTSGDQYKSLQIRLKKLTPTEQER